jgi:uncharacterized membrane protein
LLVHLSYLFFGDHPWSIRLPACIAGILIVPVTYAIGRVLAGGTVALFTAALAAASSLLIEYSVNGRGYTILCMCFLVSILAARYASEKNNVAGWTLFAIVSAVGFYTIPTMLYPFGTVLVWLALSRRASWRSCAIAAAASLAISFVLYIPVIAVSGISRIVANKYVG